jgi:hypothetical protein
VSATVPPVSPQDSEEIRSELTTARKLRKERNFAGAAQSMHKAATAAFVAGLDARGMLLARLAAEMSNEAPKAAGSVPPGSARDGSIDVSWDEDVPIEPKAPLRPRASAPAPKRAKPPSVRPSTVVDVDASWLESPVKNKPSVVPTLPKAPGTLPGKKSVVKPPPLPGEPMPNKVATTDKVPTVQAPSSHAGAASTVSSHEAVAVWIGPKGQWELASSTGKAPAGYEEAILVAKSSGAELARRLRAASKP